MQKKITGLHEDVVSPPEWLELTEIADVELTSEDPGAPIEQAFARDAPAPWRAAAPGPQTIRLRFHAPARISHVRLTFDEAVESRTQECVLRWRARGAEADREVVRQQFTFAPPGTTREREDYQVNLEDVVALELSIVPDISGGASRATLTQLLLA